MLVAAVLLAPSCVGGYATGTPVGYCTATRPIAISVSVRDSASQHAAADSASGSLQSALGVDVLERGDSLTLFGGTKLGTYDVTIQRAGYRTWTRLGVPVSHTGSCGNPTTVSLTALLQRP